MINMKVSSCTCNECYVSINVEAQSHIRKDDNLYCSQECLTEHMKAEQRLMEAGDPFHEPFRENIAFKRERYTPSPYKEADELG